MCGKCLKNECRLGFSNNLIYHTINLKTLRLFLTGFYIILSDYDRCHTEMILSYQSLGKYFIKQKCWTNEQASLEKNKSDELKEHVITSMCLENRPSSSNQYKINLLCFFSIKICHHLILLYTNFDDIKAFLYTWLGKQNKQLLSSLTKGQPKWPQNLEFIDFEFSMKF